MASRCALRRRTSTRRSWCRSSRRRRERATRAGRPGNECLARSRIGEEAVARTGEVEKIGRHSPRGNDVELMVGRANGTENLDESSAMSKELLLVVDAVANEKGVDKDVIFDAMEAALASAAKKRY